MNNTKPNIAIPTGKEWIDVPTIKTQKGEGILAQIEARSPQGVPKYKALDMKGHYGAHFLNSHIRNTLSPYYGFTNGNAGYFYGGKALVLPVPQIKLQEIFDFVPEAKPLWGQVLSQWNDNALYPLDEISAYICGLTAQIEGNSTNHSQMKSDCKNARIGLNCIEAIVNLTRGYKYSREIINFVMWCNSYINQLEKLIL